MNDAMSEGQFDRRKEDVNVAALALRVKGLEGRMELVEEGLKANGDEMRENTKVTMRTNVHIEGTEQTLGIRAKVDEVYEIFDAARSGFRYLGRVGDWMERNGKRAFWIMACIIALGTYAKTGKWPALPDWPL